MSKCEVIRNVELARQDPANRGFRLLPTPHFLGPKETLASQGLWGLCSTVCATDGEPL